MDLSHSLSDDELSILSLDMVDPVEWFSGWVQTKLILVVKEYDERATDALTGIGETLPGLPQDRVILAHKKGLLLSAQERNDAEAAERERMAKQADADAAIRQKEIDDNIANRQKEIAEAVAAALKAAGIKS